jgi:hypothetical protein
VAGEIWRHATGAIGLSIASSLQRLALEIEPFGSCRGTPAMGSRVSVVAMLEGMRISVESRPLFRWRSALRFSQSLCT